MLLFAVILTLQGPSHFNTDLLTPITWNLEIEDILLYISLAGSSLMLVIRGEISELLGI